MTLTFPQNPSAYFLLAEGTTTVTTTQPRNDCRFFPAIPVTKTLTVGHEGIAFAETSPVSVYPNPATTLLTVRCPV